MKKEIIALVRKHQLNEIVSTFQMANQFQLQLSKNDVKRLYQAMQDEVALEFGAPLSKSLFPKYIFDDSNDDSQGIFD